MLYNGYSLTLVFKSLLSIQNWIKPLKSGKLREDFLYHLKAPGHAGQSQGQSQGYEDQSRLHKSGTGKSSHYSGSHGKQEATGTKGDAHRNSGDGRSASKF
jgi:hypothetical protein